MYIFWYFIKVKLKQFLKLINSLNRQKDIEAFIPKNSKDKKYILLKKYMQIMYLLNSSRFFRW